MIPFNDLSRQSAIHGEAFNRIFREVVESGWFLNGPHLSAFEEAFANFNGLNEIAGCSSGTDALEISLRVWGIGPGHEVLVPANTWISDAEVVVRTGATPVFVDVDLATGLMDPEDIANKRSAATKAIILVHMYGNYAQVKAIRTVLGPDVKILEDHAHSVGRPVSNRDFDVTGDAHAFSFYPTKNLGALGDAGAIGSDDPDFIREARLLRDHGQQQRDDHIRVGASNRLDEIQAAILSYKLGYLSEWIDRRRQIARNYLSVLQGVNGLRPGTTYDEFSVYHLFVVWADEPGKFMEFLAKNEIGFGRHYPHALSDMDPFKNLNQVCPNATKRAAHLVSLPLYPQLTSMEVGIICDAIISYQAV